MASNRTLGDSGAPSSPGSLMRQPRAPPAAVTARVMTDLSTAGLLATRRVFGGQTSLTGAPLPSHQPTHLDSRAIHLTNRALPLAVPRQNQVEPIQSISPPGTYQLSGVLSGEGTPRGTSRQAGLIRAGALSQWGEAGGDDSYRWGEDRPEHARQPGQRRLRNQQSRPGHRIHPDRRRRTPSGHLPGRALHDLSSLLLPAPSRRARLAIRRIRAHRTHKEGLSCPNPSAASASHCQHH